ncbi:MAG: Mur ligase family protein [Gammaproteobacteria bacterium]|nr:Mur ligase family protein [Gammaproteobacteria bacterium]
MSSVRDLPALLATSPGRRRLEHIFMYRTWPLLWRAAGIYRQTMLARTRVVAVIGTYGKSTTARAISAALLDDLSLQPPRNMVGYVARRVFATRPGARHRIFETGIDGPGQMLRYHRCLHPDVVVVTSVGSEHNRSFHTLEQTRAEKVKMLEGLRSSGLAVLNGDDPNVTWMRSRTRAKVVTFGLGGNHDVVAEDMRMEWPNGTGFRLRVRDEIRQVRIRLLGEPGVRAAVAGLAVAVGEGRDLGAAIRAIEALEPTPSRLQPVPLANGAWLLRDEFKSNLETIDTALDVLAQISATKRLVVIGDISEPPATQGPLYRRLGARLAAVAARVIVIGENHKRYAAGAVKSGYSRDVFVNAGNDIRAAIQATRTEMCSDSVVLIKGRNTQRLERVALALMEHSVKCGVVMCQAKIRCEACGMLQRGWGERRFVV